MKNPTIKTKTLADLEKCLGHHFERSDLVQMALSHSSTGYETSYERLEFLGDRILGLVVAELLYETFPQEPEGDLAKRLSALVQGTFLAQRARALDLGQYIYFSDAERDAGGAQNDNILADIFEALIGALYLDAGLGKCRAFIEHLWHKHLHEMKAPPQHPKTALQEWAQGQGLPLPIYKIASQTGPDHAPVFNIRLQVEGYAPLIVQGRSRQDGEKAAAKAFFEALENTHNDLRED